MREQHISRDDDIGEENSQEYGIVRPEREKGPGGHII
jgi:hypothetical protein